MMSRHFRLRSVLSGAVAKRFPHAKNQLSVPWFLSINSLQIYKYIYIYKQVLIVGYTVRVAYYEPA